MTDVKIVLYYCINVHATHCVPSALHAAYISTPAGQGGDEVSALVVTLPAFVGCVSGDVPRSAGHAIPHLLFRKAGKNIQGIPCSVSRGESEENRSRVKIQVGSNNGRKVTI